MGFVQKINRPPWRTIVLLSSCLLLIVIGFILWTPGLDVRDGHDDRKQNGIWISHGWFADDNWFVRNNKTNMLSRYRDPASIRTLAGLLRAHHIIDVFPHLCPADDQGRLPKTSEHQIEMFLDEFAGFRVMPWVGGPRDNQVHLADSIWRTNFIQSIVSLLTRHPRLAGVHINIEPMTSGDANFLMLLDELRSGLPKEKLISIAAYPPPTRFQPYADVHWSEDYFRQVARRSNQMVVMMYDTALNNSKLYQHLMSAWTVEELEWSGSTAVLLGVPTYADAGVGYHQPAVENLENALPGIHRGLAAKPLPANYQGVAIYCEWETDTNEWRYFEEHFLKR